MDFIFCKYFIKCIKYINNNKKFITLLIAKLIPTPSVDYFNMFYCFIVLFVF